MMKTNMKRTSLGTRSRAGILAVMAAGAIVLGGCKGSRPGADPAAPAGGSAQGLEPGQQVDPELANAPLADCNENGGVQQCCSAKNCTGKVLSNRDQHNCKNNGGKSWTPGNGNCTNL